MKSFDTRVYSVSDFLEWRNSSLLDLSPDFQRRSVWNEKAKSYLIDTLLRGKPIPKILITQELKATRNVRVVVDGQQRLRAILEYVEDGFAVSRAHNEEYAGRTFSSLPNEVQRSLLKYEIGVDVLFNVTYQDLLDIFARLNTYSVKLNPQELLNATYLGYFKKAAYTLGYAYVTYWLDAGIMTRAQVSRMTEAALASDLLVALVGGVQTNKNVPAYYKRFEDEEGELEEATKRFHETMSVIGELFSPQDLKNSTFTRIHLFYSLFCSIAHCLFGVVGLQDAPRSSIKNRLPRVRVRLDEISSRYDEEERTPEYEEFVDASRRATTDTARRRFRSVFICQQIAEAV